MDKIIISDLSARGVIGVYDWERQIQQEILLNVTLFTDLRRAGRNDDVADSVDYAALSRAMLNWVAAAAPLTIEALATELARLCLNFSPGVERVQVRVEKPGAVRFARSAGVEIERNRADFEEMTTP